MISLWASAGRSPGARRRGEGIRLQFILQMYTFAQENPNPQPKIALMAPWLIVLIGAACAVALLVVGLSLTLMIKGHHID